MFIKDQHVHIVLCYKSEGCCSGSRWEGCCSGSRWCHWNFSLT